MLTAAQALTLDEVAEILSDLSGRTVRRVVVDDEDHVTGLTGHGVPEGAARMFLTVFQAARAGELAITDPTLQTLLARPTTTVRTVLSDHLAGR